MIGYRHTDPRYPFLWEVASQPEARWHPSGDGPAHYFADTPDGAWAELLRHEEIHDAADLATIRRALWAVDIGDDPSARPALDPATLGGGPETYPACHAEAKRLRAAGSTRLEAPSAALAAGGAHGWTVHGGLLPGPARDPRVIVLFGPRPDLVGWEATAEGHPGAALLARVLHF